MTFENLLAKSAHEGRTITLPAHTRHVIGAAVALFGTALKPSRLGCCWLRFFRIEDADRARFYANLLAACALHDWGKANDGFQIAVRGKRDAQAIRHEHLSALLIGLPEAMRWLQKNPLLNVAVILSAVMTHHLKAGFNCLKKHGFATKLPDTNTSSVTLLSDHHEFGQLTSSIAETLGLETLNVGQLPTAWRFAGAASNIRDRREQIKRDILNPLHRDCDASGSARKQLLLAVRAALIAADAAGSGLIREQKPIAKWIEEQFPEQPHWRGTAVCDEIINPRIEQLDKQFKKLGQPPFAWNTFQLECAGLPSRALLLAPCGSGKTLAAWRWIAARSSKNPVGRAIFLYPTRATAKEGFRDYVSWAPEAALMHGTAAFDLQGMFENEGDPRHGISYEAERRLYALGFWPKRAFSATIDQFLAFMQSDYGSVCMLPVLADSFLVVDEVHSFDRDIFSALKDFLKTFDLPVLCMTATLTEDRCQQLRECGLTLYNDRPDELKIIADRPRYHLTIAESREAVVPRVRDALRNGRRVLWVVNTVARCHEVLTLFADGFDPMAADSPLRTSEGVPIFCYHSRFRLLDRVARHEKMVERMKSGQPAALGVTTQVCEMSLDLDVDLLITESCPVTSLIQRMGRCNRDREARSLETSGEVVVYRPDDPNPYSPEDLTGVDDFLKKVQGKELNQTALEEALKAVDCPPWGGDRISMFLERGPYAVSGEEPFRDGEEYNRQCVLLEDLSCYLKTRPEQQPGLVLPVPNRWARLRDNETHPEHARLPRHLGVAAPAHYHPLLGYLDQTLDQWGIK